MKDSLIKNGQKDGNVIIEIYNDFSGIMKDYIVDFLQDNKCKILSIMKKRIFYESDKEISIDDIKSFLQNSEEFRDDHSSLQNVEFSYCITQEQFLKLLIVNDIAMIWLKNENNVIVRKEKATVSKRRDICGFIKDIHAKFYDFLLNGDAKNAYEYLLSEEMSLFNKEIEPYRLIRHSLRYGANVISLKDKGETIVADGEYDINKNDINVEPYMNFISRMKRYLIEEKYKLY